MSRGLQNNNPGNLKKMKSHFFINEIRNSTDPVFRQFYEIDFGYRAMFKQLEMYGECGINTVRKIITRWSGETREIVEPYISHVSDLTGLSPEQSLNMTDKQTLIRLVSAISEHENGVASNMKDVEEGYELLVSTQIK